MKTSMSSRPSRNRPVAACLLTRSDRVEVEATAAVIVKTLSLNGDTWRSATCEEMADVFKALTKEEGSWRTWFNNPFHRIDLHDLVDRGFAAWDGPKAIQRSLPAASGWERMDKWMSLEKTTVQSPQARGP